MTGEVLKQEESPQPNPNGEKYDLEERVRTLLTKKQKKKSDLCRYIGMTEAGMRRMFAHGSITTTVLLKIADFLDVSVTHLLPEDKRALEETEKDREIQYLKGQLKAYETALSTVIRF